MSSRRRAASLARFVALGLLLLLTLTALRYLDQHIVQAGLWMFLTITLTTGFFHGALDIVLIQREFQDGRRFVNVVTLYLASSVLLAIACVLSSWLLIPTLLAMSVWHFGEPYGRWSEPSFSQLAWIQRAIAGGAPVMLPVLFSPEALQSVLPLAVGPSAESMFVIWKIAAWCWVALCGVGFAVFRQRLFTKPLFVEFSLLFLFNLLLSPLMAFAIYFGVLHAVAHIIRVVTSHRKGAKSKQENGVAYFSDRSTIYAVVLTSVATLLMLALLLWMLKAASIFMGAQNSLLNVVLIALTALTLPHLVLVSRNSRWLT